MADSYRNPTFDFVAAKQARELRRAASPCVPVPPARPPLDVRLKRLRIRGLVALVLSGTGRR